MKYDLAQQVIVLRFALFALYTDSIENKRFNLDQYNHVDKLAEKLFKDVMHG